MIGSRPEQVMDMYLNEVLGQGRFELIPGFVADDMVDHTQTIRGTAALDAHARRFCGNIEDLEIEVERIIATDDSAIGIWRWRGIPAEPMAKSATGNDVYPRLIAGVFRFGDGMLVEYRAFVDAVDVATQLAAPSGPDRN